MALPTPSGWAEAAEIYRYRFMGFWYVQVSILLESLIAIVRFRMQAYNLYIVSNFSYTYVFQIGQILENFYVLDLKRMKRKQHFD